MKADMIRETSPKTTQPNKARFGKSSRVVVIGGGITGLSAAYRLCQLAEEYGVRLSPRLLESAPRLGGTIRTESFGGCLLEAGPDSVLTQKSAGMELCRRLGLESQLTFPGRNGGIHILNHGRIHELPPGFTGVVPTRFWPILRSPVFSLRGKLRMALEPFIAPSCQVGDESIGSLVRRRLGVEVLERVAQPILASIFLADADRLSRDMIMPQLAAIEKRHGSLIKGYRELVRQNGGAGTPKAPPFFSPRQGLRQLVDALAAALPRDCITTGVDAAPLILDRRNHSWRVPLNDGSHLEADLVILACPAHAATGLLFESAPALAGELKTVAHASCVTLNLLYRRSDIGAPLHANGFFVPESERKCFLACNFVGTKFPARVPADRAVLRVFVGGAKHPDLVTWEDEDLRRRVHRELAPILRIGREPLDALVARYERAMPRIDVGFATKKKHLESMLNSLPGLFLAGSSLGAVGIPDCIASGEQAAEAAFDYLEQVKSGPWVEAV